MNKLSFILPVALALSGCTLLPSASITGSNTQKAEKLGQIIARGGQADCKITNLADSSSTQMTVSGKKMKIVGSDLGEGKKGTIINDTVYTYMWDDGTKTGIKTKTLSESPTPSVSGNLEPIDTANQAAGFEDETKYKVDCTTRIIQDSEFAPPSDVKFTDLGEMMKAIPTVPVIPSN